MWLLVGERGRCPSRQHFCVKIGSAGCFMFTAVARYRSKPEPDTELRPRFTAKINLEPYSNTICETELTKALTRSFCRAAFAIEIECPVPATLASLHLGPRSIIGAGP
jgi:hypothetical protein